VKRFVFDALVDEENICNQKSCVEKIKRFIEDGRKVVLFGRRNRAKTSIVKNIIIPFWLKSRKNGLTIYTEFMHVKSFDDINERFTKSFSSELQRKAKVRSFLQSAVEILKGLSPTYTLADDGKMEFGLSVRGKNIIAIDILLDKLADLHKSGKPCLLCFDEFQDIAKVSGAEALLRRKFEELPRSRVPLTAAITTIHPPTPWLRSPTTTIPVTVRGKRVLLPLGMTKGAPMCFLTLMWSGTWRVTSWSGWTGTTTKKNQHLLTRPGTHTLP
jgi:hypothetical protein